MGRLPDHTTEWEGIYYWLDCIYIASFLRKLLVKEFCKLVHICRSYDETSSCVLFFSDSRCRSSSIISESVRDRDIIAMENQQPTNQQTARDLSNSAKWPLNNTNSHVSFKTFMNPAAKCSIYSTRAAFHGPTHGSATGASQPLDHGSGTVCQPGFASPATTSENFVGSWSHFCLIDTAAQAC